MTPNRGSRGLDTDLIEDVSSQLRQILVKHAPEFVNAAEGFAENVTYIPVSALGRPPEVDEGSGMLGVRPNEVRPIWAEVPLLYLLNQTSAGLIPAGETLEIAFCRVCGPRQGGAAGGLRAWLVTDDARASHKIK